MRVAKYGGSEWGELRFEATVQRDLAKQEQFLVGRIATPRASAVAMACDHVSGGGFSAASGELHNQAGTLTTLLAGDIGNSRGSIF